MLCHQRRKPVVVVPASACCGPAVPYSSWVYLFIYFLSVAGWLKLLKIICIPDTRQLTDSLESDIFMSRVYFFLFLLLNFELLKTLINTRALMYLCLYFWVRLSRFLFLLTLQMPISLHKLSSECQFSISACFSENWLR